MAFLQAFNNAGPVAGLTTTVSMTGVTAGSAILLFVTMQSENRSIASVGDSSGQTWTFKKRESNAGNGEGTELWALNNANAGTHTLTITFDASSQSASWAAAVEYGTVLSAAYDVDASVQQNTGATGWTVGPTATTNQADEYVVSFGRSTTGSRPLTTPAGFTAQVSLATTQFVIADKTVAATGTQSATWNVTGGSSMGSAVIATLKIAAAGGGAGNLAWVSA